MLYLVAAPTQDVVTLEEAKLQCRVESEDHEEDGFIQSLIDAATQALDGAEGWLGRCLVSQTWELRLDAFCEDKIRVPLPPLIAVDHVKYYDTANALQTLSTANYTVGGVGAKQAGFVELNYSYTWPDTYQRSEAVRIQFTAGYTDTGSSPSAEIPSSIKQAILLMVAELYAQREISIIGTIIEQIPTIEHLLSPYRVPFFA